MCLCVRDWSTNLLCSCSSMELQQQHQPQPHQKLTTNHNQPPTTPTTTTHKPKPGAFKPSPHPMESYIKITATAPKADGCVRTCFQKKEQGETKRNKRERREREGRIAMQVNKKSAHTTLPHQHTHARTHVRMHARTHTQTKTISPPPPKKKKYTHTHTYIHTYQKNTRSGETLKKEFITHTIAYNYKIVSDPPGLPIIFEEVTCQVRV
jgi:hypothetical protein